MAFGSYAEKINYTFICLLRASDHTWTAREGWPMLLYAIRGRGRLRGTDWAITTCHRLPSHISLTTLLAI